MIEAKLSPEELRKRFLRALKDAPAVSQASIARACGVTAQAVSAWKQSGQIDKSHFPALAKTLGKPLEYWFGGADRVRAYEVRGVDGHDGVDDNREVMVGEVDVELGAGDGVPLEFVETRYRLPFQLEWLRSIGVRKDQDVRLMQVRGNSMERTLFDGDKVLIHLAETRIISDRVYAIMLDGEPRIKRLFNTADGVRIVSDNDDKVKYPDEFVTGEMADRLHIIGRALHRQGSQGL